jgi:predicted nuclease of predicted toxin-antitoxin system
MSGRRWIIENGSARREIGDGDCSMPSSPPPAMRFFTDQNVPDAVNRFLISKEYHVIALRQQIPTDSPDSLVAAVAEANNAILVTFDSDFKAIASRYGIGQKRFTKLSLIRFEKCRESQAAWRFEEALSLIDHEWSHGHLQNLNRRLFVVITSQTIRTHR